MKECSARRQPEAAAASTLHRTQLRVRSVLTHIIHLAGAHTSNARCKPYLAGSLQSASGGPAAVPTGATAPPASPGCLTSSAILSEAPDVALLLAGAAGTRRDTASVHGSAASPTAPATVSTHGQESCDSHQGAVQTTQTPTLSSRRIAGQHRCKHCAGELTKCSPRGAVARL